MSSLFQRNQLLIAGIISASSALYLAHRLFSKRAQKNCAPPDISCAGTLLPMPLLPISSTATIEMCRNLELRDSDIFICSYPKSGTTWMQQ